MRSHAIQHFCVSLAGRIVLAADYLVCDLVCGLVCGLVCDLVCGPRILYFAIAAVFSLEKKGC